MHGYHKKTLLKFFKNQQDRQSTETLLNMLVTVDQHKYKDVSSALGQPDAGQWASGELSELWTILPRLLGYHFVVHEAFDVLHRHPWVFAGQSRTVTLVS